MLLSSAWALPNCGEPKNWLSYPSTGLTAAGLPVGLELDARPGSDRRLPSNGLAPRAAW